MPAKLIKIDPNNPEEKEIAFAAKILKKGGLVSFPTETVYGLAANFLDKKAVAKIYEVKKRPKDKPLPVAIADKKDIEKLAKNILPAAWRLIDNFWPGPLTLILKSRHPVTNNDKIGIRMPDNEVAVKIIQRLNAPIVLTSANISGDMAVCSAEKVMKDLGGLIDLIVDAGKTKLGKESTVLDATGLPFQVLRRGAIAEDEINKLANRRTVAFICTGNSCRSVMAKALLEKFTKNRDDINVLSAGIFPGTSVASSETIELLKREGMDVSGHIPEAVNDYIISRSDVILTMDAGHKHRILSLAPEAHQRVYLLKEFAQIKEGSLDIDDPMGRGLHVYEICLRQIKEAVEKVAKLL